MTYPVSVGYSFDNYQVTYSPGAYGLTQVTLSTVAAPAPAVPEPHANIAEVPGWKLTPEDLLKVDDAHGWTAAAQYVNWNVVRDADGALYVRKGIPLRLARAADKDSAVYLKQYRETQYGTRRLAAFIPAKAAETLRVLGTSGAPAKSEYLPIAKLVKSPEAK